MSLRDALEYAVLAGGAIPAHDQTFDLADQIAEKLNDFRSYVASVRDAAQADAALTELVEAIWIATDHLTRERSQA